METPFYIPKTMARVSLKLVSYFRYGEHYWMMDVNMNCEDTDNGWFDLKVRAFFA